MNGLDHRIGNYGPSQFTDDKWLMTTGSRHHVLQVTDVNEGTNPIEIKYVDNEQKKSFVALFKLDQDRLIIARGINSKPDKTGHAAIPSPGSIEPGSGRLVYTFVRSTESMPLFPKITIRVRDSSFTPPQILVDQTLDSNIGGTFRYHFPENSPRDEWSNPGTYIDGKIQTADTGETRVATTIRITTAHPPGSSPATVLRSRAYRIETPLSDRAATVDCGDQVTCEFSISYPTPDSEGIRRSDAP